MNIKKGQRIKINLESFRKELDSSYKLYYKSIPFRMRNKDYYKKQLSTLEEKYNNVFSNFEKEEPLVINVNSDGYIDIIFSDKSEVSINSKHVVDVIDSKPKIEEVKKVEPKVEQKVEPKVEVVKKLETKKTDVKKVEPKKSSSMFKKKKK